MPCEVAKDSPVFFLSKIGQEPCRDQQNSGSCVARDLCNPVIFQNRTEFVSIPQLVVFTLVPRSYSWVFRVPGISSGTRKLLART
jgi:hypothetical protein